MTLGRGAGGPVGGWLTDVIGWRWYVTFARIQLHFA